MASVEAHESKPRRQANIRFFLDSRRGCVEAQQSCAAWFPCGVPDLVTVINALFWFGAPTAAR